MIIFGKPPDKIVDWNIWTPLVPHNFKKYFTYAVLGVSAFFSFTLVVILLQSNYRAVIYDVLYNSIIFNIFSEITTITTQIFAVIITLIVTLIFILVLLILHEYMHFICYPKFWRTRTYVYFDIRTLALCLFYDGETSKIRRILINLMPLIILSFGMFFVSFIFDGNLHYILQITALCNFALSSADIIGVFLLLRLPSKAVLDNGIWRQDK